MACDEEGWLQVAQGFDQWRFYMLLTVFSSVRTHSVYGIQCSLLQRGDGESDYSVLHNRLAPNSCGKKLGLRERGRL